MRPLPPRATLFARRARRLPGLVFGLLAGVGTSACSFTTDFDAPYPGDPATDAATTDAGTNADMGGVCGRDCADTVQCLGALACEGSAYDDQMARFEGFCRADCRDNNDNAYRVGACTGQVYGDLTERYRDAFVLACGADESLCDAYCLGASDDGGAEVSLYEQCVNRAPGRLSALVCKQQCGRLSVEFWRCVGAAQYDTPDAGECVRERACLDKHPLR